MTSITCANAARLAGLLLLAAAGLTVAATPVMYRFTNERGEPVYSYTLPPEQAKDGYQKIDPHTGRVLESVAPQLPPDELAAKLRREQAMKECRDELDRLYQLYGTEGDLDYALAETLESLENRISQLRSNLRQARAEQRRLQSQAADAERMGREIPPTLLTNISRARSQIETLEGEIEQRHAEQQDAKARHAYELERFRDGTCPVPDTLASSQ